MEYTQWIEEPQKGLEYLIRNRTAEFRAISGTDYVPFEALGRHGFRTEWTNLFGHYDYIRLKSGNGNDMPIDLHARLATGVMGHMKSINFPISREVKTVGHQSLDLLLDYFFVTDCAIDMGRDVLNWLRMDRVRALEKVSSEKTAARLAYEELQELRAVKAYQFLERLFDSLEERLPEKLFPSRLGGFVLDWARKSRSVRMYLDHPDFVDELDSENLALGLDIESKKRYVSGGIGSLHIDNLKTAEMIYKSGISRDAKEYVMAQSLNSLGKTLAEVDLKETRLWGLMNGIAARSSRRLTLGLKDTDPRKLLLVKQGMNHRVEDMSRTGIRRQGAIDMAYFFMQRFRLEYIQEGNLVPNYLLGFIQAYGEATDLIAQDYAKMNGTGEKKDIELSSHALMHQIVDMTAFLVGSFSRQEIYDMAESHDFNFPRELQRVHSDHVVLARQFTPRKYKVGLVEDLLAWL
ncbi:MAG: hypothetical protein KKG59_00810 [Nanoarchaeota archaeon]|nr:hypothetical protein [Nanoarchaeota archaeon]